MKKIAVIFLLVFGSLTARAQLLNAIDVYLNKIYNRVNYDTAYIVRPLNTKWTIAFRPFLDWTTYNVSGTIDDIPYDFHLRSELNPKLSIYGGYLGIGASLSRSVNQLIGGKDADWNFKFSTYGNRFGFAFSLSEINSMNGTFSFRDGSSYWSFKLPKDFVTQTSMYANFYYAVNNKKFSYPAAFSHSFVQKRSAGSLLIGGALNLNITTVGDSLQQTEMIHVINGMLGAGVGYAYNLVLPNDWLIHASVLPYLVVLGATIYQFADEPEESAKAEFPESFIVGRTAVIHTMGRWFAGATGQLNYYNIRCDDLRAGCQDWEIIAFVGVRL